MSKKIWHLKIGYYVIILLIGLFLPFLNLPIFR